MRKSILFIKSFMVMAALSVVSCNTDDGMICPEPLTGPLNATETAFSGTWVFSAMVAADAIDLTNDNIDNPSTDIFAQNTSCERDLVYDFKTNRDYSLKQGYLAPDCNNKQSLTGTWALTSGNALSFVANCSSQTVQIVMNETGDAFSYETTLDFRDVKGNPKNTKVTFTYEKVVEDETPQ